MKQTWRQIPGLEGAYEVSDKGRVRSVRRMVLGRLLRGMVLRQRQTEDGYLRVFPSKDGARKSWMVHRLVALAFLPPPEGRMSDWTVNHKDGNKTNNSVENLEWSTVADNVRHAFAAGLVSRNKIFNRLSIEQVKQIKERLSLGHPKRAIARQFGVGTSAIYYIAKGLRHACV